MAEVGKSQRKQGAKDEEAKLDVEEHAGAADENQLPYVLSAGGQLGSAPPPLPFIMHRFGFIHGADLSLPPLSLSLLSFYLTPLIFVCPASLKFVPVRCLMDYPCNIHSTQY
jgi:hypothetical protein